MVYIVGNNLNKPRFVYRTGPPLAKARGASITAVFEAARRLWISWNLLNLFIEIMISIPVLGSFWVIFWDGSLYPFTFCWSQIITWSSPAPHLNNGNENPWIHKDDHDNAATRATATKGRSGRSPHRGSHPVWKGWSNKHVIDIPRNICSNCIACLQYFCVEGSVWDWMKTMWNQVAISLSSQLLWDLSSSLQRQLIAKKYWKMTSTDNDAN